MAGGVGMRAISAEFIKFSIIGTLGFVVDATVLHVLLAASGLGLYASRLVSFLIAATTTWFLNRNFTFHGGSKANARRQWGRFVLVNGMGGAVNYGVYAALVANSESFASYPVMAVAIGSISGLLINFTASRQLVFR